MKNELEKTADFLMAIPQPILQLIAVSALIVSWLVVFKPLLAKKKIADLAAGGWWPRFWDWVWSCICSCGLVTWSKCITSTEENAQLHLKPRPKNRGQGRRGRCDFRARGTDRETPRRAKQWNKPNTGWLTLLATTTSATSVCLASRAKPQRTPSVKR